MAVGGEHRGRETERERERERQVGCEEKRKERGDVEITLLDGEMTDKVKKERRKTIERWKTT